MDVYTLASVKIASTVITGITRQGFSPNLTRLTVAGSGAVDPSFTGVVRAAPQLTFGTTSIKAALAALGGISGQAIAASNFNFWLAKTALNGLRTAGANQFMATVVAGYIVPQAIRARLGAAAEIDYVVYMVSADGTTTPVTFTVTGSLDAGEGGASQLYTLGAVSINGTAIDGIDDVTITFNLDVQITGGLTYPTHAACISRGPIITLTTFSLATFNTWGLLGAAQTASDSVINLDDVTEGAARGTTPITFTIDEGAMNFQGLDTAHGGRTGGQAIITPTFDGTAAILVVGGIA